MRSQMSFSTND